MYIEKKKIKGKIYLYLKVSVRVGNKIKTKTIAYLGKEPMTKKQIKEKIASIPKSKIELVKEELKKGVENINIQFLTKIQLQKVTEIKKDFIKKLKRLDKKLLEDMFKDFKTYYIYNTNAIEGNTLSLEETNLLLNENKSPENKDLREIYDHTNEKETFDFLLEKKHSKLLKKIDKRIGYFRKHNVRIFGDYFKTTAAKYIHIDIKILLKWYQKNKKKIHPLILAAIFHEKFERIHPFYDGNGRTGRMLMNLILLKNNLPPLIIKNRIRKKYYDVLSDGHKADFTSLDPKYYKQIVSFCYKQFLDTYKDIFSKWG